MNLPLKNCAVPALQSSFKAILNRDDSAIAMVHFSYRRRAGASSSALLCRSPKLFIVAQADYCVVGVAAWRICRRAPRLFNYSAASFCVAAESSELCVGYDMPLTYCRYHRLCSPQQRVAVAISKPTTCGCGVSARDPQHG